MQTRVVWNCIEPIIRSQKEQAVKEMKEEIVEWCKSISEDGIFEIGDLIDYLQNGNNKFIS